MFPVASVSGYLRRVAGLIMATQISMVVMMSEARASEFEIDWSAHKRGPQSSASVYWVGHSLIEAQVETSTGPIDVMRLVAQFAKSRELAHEFGDHTLWGSSLSALWRGRPHGYSRDASVMVEKREAFERDARAYDTLVLTEGLPLEPSFEREFSSYYVRRFYCTLKRQNKNARVYISQTWINFQGLDPDAQYPPAHQFDWRAEMVRQRSQWEHLADTARHTSVATPSWLSRFGWSPKTDAGCNSTDPIFIIPVGNVLVALADRLAIDEDSSHWRKDDGSRLQIADFFSNPYTNWPKGWPVKKRTSQQIAEYDLSRLTLVDPSRLPDDIHPSAMGIYLSSLVHFAVIYGQSPVGLEPHPIEIGRDLARELQCLVWNVVTNDERTGVDRSEKCPS